MKKKLFPIVIITLVVTLINTGMLIFLTADKIGVNIKNRPVVISKDYDKGQTYQKALETKKPVIVWFYTDWCGYCQKFAPTFKKITKQKAIKEKFAIAYINGEEEENQKYIEEFDVKGYPMVFLINGNKKEMISPIELFKYDAVESLTEKFLDFID